MARWLPIGVVSPCGFTGCRQPQLHGADTHDFVFLFSRGDPVLSASPAAPVPAASSLAAWLRDVPAAPLPKCCHWMQVAQTPRERPPTPSPQRAAPGSEFQAVGVVEGTAASRTAPSRIGAGGNDAKLHGLLITSRMEEKHATPAVPFMVSLQSFCSPCRPSHPRHGGPLPPAASSLRNRSSRRSHSSRRGSGCSM